MGSVVALDRSVAQELVLITSIAPLVVSNVAVDYLPEIFATDASNQKGAIVKAPIASRNRSGLMQIRGGAIPTLTSLSVHSSGRSVSVISTSRLRFFSLVKARGRPHSCTLTLLEVLGRLLLPLVTWVLFVRRIWASLS